MNKTIINNYVYEASKSLRGFVGENPVDIAIKVLILKVLLSDSNFALHTVEGWKALLSSSPSDVSAATWGILNDNTAFKKIAPETLVKIIAIANEMGINKIQPQDFSLLTKIQVDNVRRSDCLYYKQGYSELILAMAEINEQSTVYTTSPATLSILGDILPRAKEVSYESFELSYLAQSFKELFTDGVVVEFGDVYHNPKFVQAGKLQKFDTGITLPPFGMQLNGVNEIVKTDHLGRFIFESRNSESLTIQHVMAHCTDMVVATVPLGFLFKTIEQSFRQYLIKNGLLKTIIFLPSDSMAGTSIPTAILVIDLKGGHDSVRFVDVEMAGFTEKERRAVHLVNVDELVAKINSNENFEGIATISNAAIMENKFDLTAGHYPLSQADKEFNDFLQSREAIPLNKIVNFERALPVTVKNSDDDTAIRLWEASSHDLINDYLQQPIRDVMVAGRALDEFEDCFLQPKDILIITKGSNIGRVSFVPDHAPDIGENGWVASQFVTVLRMKRSSPITAEALFVFLRSEVGQKLLSKFSVGTSVANLPLSSLRNLEVFVPTEDEQAKALDIVQQDIAADKQIQQMIEQKSQRYKSLWSL